MKYEVGKNKENRCFFRFSSLILNSVFILLIHGYLPSVRNFNNPLLPRRRDDVDTSRPVLPPERTLIGLNGSIGIWTQKCDVKVGNRGIGRGEREGIAFFILVHIGGSWTSIARRQHPAKLVQAIPLLKPEDV